MKNCATLIIAGIASLVSGCFTLAWCLFVAMFEFMRTIRNASLKLFNKLAIKTYGSGLSQLLTEMIMTVKQMDEDSYEQIEDLAS